MSKLTWLHLSDWHQRGEDFDRRVVRDALLADLRDRGKINPRLSAIDLFIFSGDAAFCGVAAEFEAAQRSLFDPVLNAIALKPDRLFLVPGNHDLNRNIIPEMLPPELQKPPESDIVVKKWLTDEKKRQRAMEPLEDYYRFVASLTGQKTPDFASVVQISIGGLQVALLGLNSAWMCGRNKDPKGEVNDYGFLAVGEPQLHDSLARIEHCDVRIAVVHHPFSWLQSFEQSKIRERLHKVCHFVLRGHEHDPDFAFADGLQGQCVTVPAGACYERRKADDPRYVNAYNFVHLDFETGKGTIFLRRWSEKRHQWIEDMDSAPLGIHEFTLPKQLGEQHRQRSITATVGHSSQPDLRALEQDYLRHTIECFKELSFRGLTSSVRPILLPLEDVYVQLRAVAEVPESADEFTPEERQILRWLEEKQTGKEGSGDLREAQMRLDALRRERWTRERLERFPIADTLKDPRRRGLVILGDPGSGKSTLLHFLALVFARGPRAVLKHLAIAGEEGNRLPIFAPLAAYDDMLDQDRQLTIREFLPKYYAARRNMPQLAPLFERAIDSGRALVLLDGMDEVLREDRRKFVADQASAFIRALIHRGNRVLLTSRIYGYRTAPLSVDLPHVTLLDFR